MKNVYRVGARKPGTVEVQANYGAYHGVSGSFGGGVLLTRPNFGIRKGETTFVIRPANGGPPFIVGVDGD